MCVYVGGFLVNDVLQLTVSVLLPITTLFYYGLLLLFSMVRSVR